MADAQVAADEKTGSKLKDFIQKFADFLDAYPGSGLRESVRLIPDGLFLGTGLFALMSQSYAVSILFLTLFETVLIHMGLQNLFTYISLEDTLPTKEGMTNKCVSGFYSPTLNTLAGLFNIPMKSTLPSPPILLLTTACVYVISCMQSFISEMQELGPGFSTRYYLSIVFTVLLLIMVCILRMLTGCDTWGIVIISLLIGAGLGLALSYQNKTLLGKEAINILGVPVFSNTTADGKPIYICPKKI